MPVLSYSAMATAIWQPCLQNMTHFTYAGKSLVLPVRIILPGVGITGTGFKYCRKVLP
jgi:hypothetical protein